ncbi:MAG: hypothetical protein ACRD5G_01085 [Candidatus Acidiferrales bacterium]
MLGMTWLEGRGAVLVRLDPLTLHTLGRQVDVGEYHSTWSFSPDASQLALGISAPGDAGRLGIQIIDVKRMETVGRVATGIAAEIVAWLTPDRIVASLQGGGIVLVDAASGEIVRRWPQPFLLPVTGQPKPVAYTRNGAVFLLKQARNLKSVIAFVNGHGDPGYAFVECVRSTRSEWAGPGLAVDVARDRAFVVGCGARVAEIDLKTMHVRRHKVAGLDRRDRESNRHALWLENELLAVFGMDVGEHRGRRVGIPPKIQVIDTTNWRARTIDARANRAIFVAGRLLVYGSHSSGLRAYSLDGRQRFSLFSNERIRDVRVAGTRAYVLGPNHLRTVDIKSGAVIREVPIPPGLVELIAPSR